MNLSAAIHTRWAAASALNTLLPAARLFTGRIPRGTAKPCARLHFPGSVGGKLSDKARERAVQVRITHWVVESAFGTGQDIQDAIEAAFDNYSAALEDSTLVKLTHDNSFYVQDEEATSKLFQFVTQFTATIQKDRTL
jgi:hypothetical protein